MSEFYKWDPSQLATGIHEMDREHQELILRMNALYDGVAAKVPAARVKMLLDGLGKYVVQHFRDEEAYMEKVGFPGLDTHKIIHKQLLTQFGEHVEMFNRTQAMSPAFFNFLKVWLTGHIRGIDMKYSEFARSKHAA